MKILPAIDVMDGQCVRLFQGDFKTKNVYYNDITEIISLYKQKGANYLHLIDLSGAKNPDMSQKKWICEKVASAGLKFQIGGGIRTTEQIREILESGADRIIVGSLTVRQPELVQEWISTFGMNRFVLALDYRRRNGDFMLATHGWQKTSNVKLFDMINYYLTEDVRIIATNIDKDGSLASPDFELYELIKQQFPQVILQASGGISSEEDISRLDALGVQEAVIGKAIYENKVSLDRILKND